MRLRNKPWAQELIKNNEQYILVEPTAMAGNWQKRFAKSQPLELELGSGKGKFILEQAKKHPEKNFIAMELQTMAAAMILKKQLAEKLPNLQILVANGQNLLELFAVDEISKMYLNFSDPWPKTRHEKRRLTAPNFLKLYQQVLQDNGQLEFKTDNQGLFEYSLVSMSNYGLHFEQISLNLHASVLADDNVTTEYEEKFAQKGQPIYFLTCRF
ncbi:tRNA (guanosine(46)-N7)-methyltransferase TrmB [Bombilactobacillus thymidiniphilus]|uniref:tRNA (guanine-N(7)-)-methyltransferase n=1 Tax=Bombilactobacillus thymidiniphilus TaxID=2923363 RepID=A0ABY4PCW4_9LACO|nr:tRNA (guanosine(46)-N7)-methyltransferase TrmB [Bombilactobacillus thymidiniphilus]UQS83346.1 tRNA (guanosine(46)-N7)-methyltransferase TrmB [Bombilactobacillus thymidiniphilus]